MNSIDDLELGAKVLPGVDLALWIQIVFAALFVLVAGGVALALV
jgi:hypothetical protein